MTLHDVIKSVILNFTERQKITGGEMQKCTDCGKLLEKNAKDGEYEVGLKLKSKCNCHGNVKLREKQLTRRHFS